MLVRHTAHAIAALLNLIHPPDNLAEAQIAQIPAKHQIRAQVDAMERRRIEDLFQLVKGPGRVLARSAVRS